MGKKRSEYNNCVCGHAEPSHYMTGCSGKRSSNPAFWVSAAKVCACSRFRPRPPVDPWKSALNTIRSQNG